MQDFIYFLGRFHVLVLHLPIGILLLAIGLECASRTARFSNLKAAVPIVWLVGALSAVLAVTLGYMHASEPGFTGAAVNLHRWSGVLLAGVSLAVWGWQRELPRLYDKAWPIGSAAVAILLVSTGHFGGNLTHGNTYLTEFAPGFLGGGAKARPALTKVEDADIWRDIVHPALQSRCAGCHNDEKRRGAFSVASYERLKAGGESGPVVEPGNRERSELFKRITLPSGHEDFMPKDGKTPLSPDQIELIGWWINAGALKEGTLGKLNMPDPIKKRAAKLVGL